MTTLDFADALVENAFSFSNLYSYGDKKSYGLYFWKESQNYPFILKGGQSDDFELEYSLNTYQLRGRLLNTKKLKEVMNTARLPLYFVIKQIPYLVGKGFLSAFDSAGNHQLLFIACVEGMKNITSIQQVKFYVSKAIYEDRHKAVQTAVKDLIASHAGDVIMCNNILDYLGERITFPRGGSLSELNKYKQAVVRTCLMQDFVEGNPANEPLVVDSNRGTVSIEAISPDILDQLESFGMLPTSDIVGALRGMWSVSNPGQTLDTTASVVQDDLPMAMVRSLTNLPPELPIDSPDDELPY